MWTGRFYTNVVVVAGPGLGKSTMMALLAHTYARDGFLVLKVSLRSVAAAMREGRSFEDSIFQMGLDGSGITLDTVRQLSLRGWVVLADGLDESGARHDEVAFKLTQFANGHPSARVIVTTRPIGYETAALAGWRHYRLLSPDMSEGAKNFEALIRAAADSEEMKTSASEISSRALASSAASEAISASPQMLGMATSLIVQNGTLPASRSQLYARLIKLLEGLPTKHVVACYVSAPELNRVLAILGWTILTDPLAKADAIAQQCSKFLAEDLGSKPLAVANKVEAAIAHWESVGLVERLHHDGTTLLTFIHKTFAEFAAAKFLNAIVDDSRVEALARVIADPDWKEVVSFAGGIGMGNEIAELFSARRRTTGQIGQLERALALIGDVDANISEPVALGHRLIKSTPDAK